MVYIVGWTLMLQSSLLLLSGFYKIGKFSVYISMLYCFLLAFFRADIGTDTVTYQNIFQSLANGGNAAFGEIGFSLLAKSLIFLFDDINIAVNAVSIIFFALLFFFVKKSTKNELFVFSSFILPVIAYQYSMNALRIGVAFVFFLVIFQYVLRSGFYSRIKLGLLSVIFHFSAFFYMVYFYFFNSKIFTAKFFIGFIFIIFALIVILFYWQDYFLIKINLYSDYSAPSKLSGLRVVLPIFIILLGTLLSRLKVRNKIKILVFAMIPTISFFLLVQVSYSGLRFLDLLLVSVPLILLIAFENEGKYFDLNIKLSFLLAGIIFSVGTYIGFDDNYLPYRSLLG